MSSHHNLETLMAKIDYAKQLTRELTLSIQKSNHKLELAETQFNEGKIDEKKLRIVLDECKRLKTVVNCVYGEITRMTAEAKQILNAEENTLKTAFAS